MIRIIIADDHAVVRYGLSSWLSAIDDFDVVGLAGDGQEAVEMCEAWHPDVVLMDLSMPTRNGVEATARIHEASPEIAVIALTTTHDGEMVNAAIDAGARGYLLKDVEPEMLVSSIRSVFAGGLPLSPLVAARLFRINRSPRGMYETLTPRERQILDMIAKGEHNKEIASELGISEKTVRVHCSHLFQRLGVVDRTQAAVWAARSLPRDTPN
jgi:DNA-binding NarL/FixJ family response regulator